MANSSAKKQLKANSQRLQLLRLLILVANAAYALRFLIFRSAFTTFHKVLWPVMLALYAAPSYFIWMAARPSYSDTGALIDGGDDITKPGILEYAHDLIYVTVFAQLGLVFTKWAALIFLTVLAFAIYMSCASGASMLSAPEVDEGNAVEDFAGMSRKERRKAEREARKHR